MQRGRKIDKALLRTLANKKDQNFATRRILRDLKEIEEETIPTVGVVARPLDDNLFEWHGNIKGPVGTPYEGGVFHIVIEIPESYPHQPPKIRLATPFYHENVFGSFICLDMLNPSRGKSQGWTSGYSIQSILIQLQSFLFEQEFPESEEEEEDDEEVEGKKKKKKKKKESATMKRIKQEIKNANEYVCRRSGHKGKSQPFPPFKETKQEDEDFTIADFDDDTFFGNEVVCYHTKLSFKGNEKKQSEENIKIDQQDWRGVAIGLGLNIRKVPRTGLIQHAQITMDYISIKAFIKEGIRWSCNNEYFTQWLPIYFGNLDSKERALHLGEKSLSYIMTNSTKRFKPEFVLNVFPQIFTTLIFQFYEKKRHISIQALRILSHLHANFIMYLEKYPQLYDVIDKHLENFIKNDSYRIKDNTPNLSTIMVYLLVSNKVKFEDAIEAYHQEQLDRQVFWMLRSVPELIEEKNLNKIDQDRADLTFKCQITSYQMLSFFKEYIFTLRKLGNNPKSVFESYEKTMCKLPMQLEDQLQKNAQGILENISSFNTLYKFIGLKEKSLQEINQMLKQAIINSANKKYHGEMSELHTLPSSQDQFLTLLQKLPQLNDFYNITTIEDKEKKGKKGVGKKHQVCELKKEFSQEDWKKASQKRWVWITEALRVNPDLTPTQLAQMSIDFYTYTQTQESESKRNNILFQKIQKEYKNKKIPEHVLQIQLPEQTWQQLFIKLDLEDTLVYFDKILDFQVFYEKITVAKSLLTCLTIPIYDIQKVKSGYHYLTSILTNLTKLKYLEISSPPQQTNQQRITLKQITALSKGLYNFINNGGKLIEISFNNLSAVGSDVEITDKIFSPISLMTDLVSLKFNNTNLLQKQNAAKSLGNIIINVRSIQQLVLINNIFTSTSQAKEIADSLMRAKNLKFVNISGNSTGVGYQGLAAIIYNLAFSGNLESLNISRCNCSSNGSIVDVVEALYKLLKINNSLKHLDCSNVTSLNQNLSKDFFIHVGNIKTLEILNLKNSGQFSSSVICNLGKAVAFNSMKGGSLQHINLDYTINAKSLLDAFYENMNVSKYDHEVWYGDPIKAQKMEGDDHKKKFYNNLQSLILQYCNSVCTYFDIKDFKKYNREDTKMLKLFSRSPKLETLQMSGTGLKNNDADFFTVVLDPRRANFASQIKILDLSKNNFGKEGIKTFSKIFEYNNILETVDLSSTRMGVSGSQFIASSLKKNKTVKFLNLFQNKIGFDGARALAETLKVNNTLEFLELGHNRIRNNGLISLAEGIVANPNSKIKDLGLRFNFITEYGAIKFIGIINKNKSLAQVYLKNNRIYEYGLYQMKQVFDEYEGITFNFDIFEKLRFLDQEKMERSVYVHPVFNQTAKEIKTFFESTQECGIVLDVRIRKGPTWPNRKQQENKFAIVEFADITSTTRALAVASRKRACFQGRKFRIFRAGTGTYAYCKKSTKQKTAETSKTNITKCTEEDPNRNLYARNNRRDGRDRRDGGNRNNRNNNNNRAVPPHAGRW